MALARVLILDGEAGRLAVTSEWLRTHGYEAIGAASEGAAIEKLENEAPDLILLRVGAGIEIFSRLAAVANSSATLIVPFIERSFSSAQRREVLALEAGGFIYEALPEDELIASLHALVRQRRRLLELNRIIDGRNGEKFQAPPLASDPEATLPAVERVKTQLRERSPELYQGLLCRYENAVKLVLHHRIYKISDDIFEPFRQIARDLFLANASARDALELHYQTMRKIAPTPEAPRAQAYLEVGRTTIIGLMGDLLTFYRNAHRSGTAKPVSSHQEPTERISK
jgi:DNA-binding response OmpR family regulator